MTARKYRQPIVLDTNVFIRALKSRSDTSPNRRIVRLWLLEKQLQLVLSPELMNEYLETFEEGLGINSELLEKWRLRFEHDNRTTLVNPGRRYTESRDPDDNIVLATARAGRVDFLVTNDRDLFELSNDFRKSLPFAIVTPQSFLREWD